MSKESTIEHEGFVTEIANGVATVEILSVSACASCHAKGACSASEMQEKAIDAYTLNLELKKGDKVVVAGKTALGFQAVGIAYVLPFLLMLGSMIATIQITQSEALAGAVAIGVLPPFYFVLYLFRNRLKKNFSFYIKKIIE